MSGENPVQASEEDAIQAAPKDGVRFDEQTGTWVARYTILTAGRSEEEARTALAGAVRLLGDAWPRSGAVIPAGPKACRTCRNLRAFELVNSIYTCPVLNIRLHAQTVLDGFGCSLYEPKADGNAE